MDDEGASASGSNVSSEIQGFSLVTSEYQKAKRKNILPKEMQPKFLFIRNNLNAGKS